MSKECLLSIKHQKISMVKIIIVSLVFIALLSIIRAIFFHYEITKSMINDLKKEARILTEYSLLTKKSALSSYKHRHSLESLKEENGHRDFYVKYVVVGSLNEENRADEEELRLINYFLLHKDVKEYFHEYLYKDEPFYQYALPIYVEDNISLTGETLTADKLQAMISVRISYKRAFKGLYSLIFKEIVFSLLIIVVMLLLVLFLYRDTKKQISKMNDEASRYAFTDALTGLYNRHYLDHFLEKFIPMQNSEKCFAVLFIDIDDFKEVNDHYGHLVGDCVLKELGKKLQSLARHEDLLCRYGGEEFLIIIPNITRELVLERAEDIRSRVDEMELACQKQRITISLGMSCGKNYDTIHTIIEQADKALYRAKKSGKNCIEIF